MSHSGTEYLALLRTDEAHLDEAIDRLSRRRPGRVGSKGRGVYLQYEFGGGHGRSIFGGMFFEELLDVRWSYQEEELGIDVLDAEDVMLHLEQLRGRLLRPRTLARDIHQITGEDRLTADLVREQLKRYRKDADPGSAESESERLLQAAAQLYQVLKQAARKRQAVVASSGELSE
ncbi:MAG: hypothetical protein MUF64_13585 [Polyangiaceae bacterium]|jgi:hypothetical protein|nr:hypothetical protein [Polyangiaceae bacterium]